MSAVDILGQNILLRSPNWLGDAVMTLPAVQALQAAVSPGTEISILTPQKLADFWRMVPGLKNVLTAEHNPFRTGADLRPHDFTTVIVLPNSLRTGLEAWLARIPRRYGYAGDWRALLFTESWPKPVSKTGWEHQRWHYLKLMEHLGVPVPDRPFQPLPKPVAVSSGGKARLIVCPGAEYGPAKRWPVESFAGTVKLIREKHDFEVLILGGARDVAAGAELNRLLDGGALDKTGKTSLCEFLAQVAHAGLVLCNDSGAMHAAAAFATPALAVFGSTEPLLTGPIHPSVAVLREHVACSPCFLRECPIDFRCMKSVTSAQAAEAAEQLLKNHPMTS